MEIAPGLSACAAARDAAGKKFLMRRAPALPLAQCNRPDQCKCRFSKSSDRRESERRLEGSVLARCYTGKEGRKDNRRRPAPR